MGVGLSFFSMPPFTEAGGIFHTLLKKATIELIFKLSVLHQPYIDRFDFFLCIVSIKILFNHHDPVQL